MSEDKTQNGYEGSQELDFQDAKEMTVGEAVRKEAEINAGVTETAVSYTHLTLPTKLEV